MWYGNIILRLSPSMLLNANSNSGGLCNIAFGAAGSGNLVMANGSTTTNAKAFGDSWIVPPAANLFGGVDQPSLYSVSTTAT